MFVSLELIDTDHCLGERCLVQGVSEDFAALPSAVHVGLPAKEDIIQLRRMIARLVLENQSSQCVFIHRSQLLFVRANLTHCILVLIRLQSSLVHHGLHFELIRLN